MLFDLRQLMKNENLDILELSALTQIDKDVLSEVLRKHEIEKNYYTILELAIGFPLVDYIDYAYLKKTRNSLLDWIMLEEPDGFDSFEDFARKFKVTLNTFYKWFSSKETAVKAKLGLMEFKELVVLTENLELIDLLKDEITEQILIKKNK